MAYDSTHIESPAVGPRTGPGGASHRTLHVLLSLISLTIVLISINRKGGFTLAFVANNEFLRWVEVNNMVLGLCTVVLYYLVTRNLVTSSTRHRATAQAALGVVFVVGAYVYALSFGDHEVTNYLHGRFCTASASSLCRIVAFNDDDFSDFLFLAGFTVLNLVVMLTQAAYPSSRPLRARDNILIFVNALFVSAGIVANLAFEKAVFDPYVVAATAVLSLVLLWRAPRQPMLRYYSVAYVLGILATAVVALL